MNRRKRMLESLDADIRDHIAQRTQENIDLGMSPDDARYAALRKFGNLTRVKEDTREVWSFVWLEELLQDIRYGARSLIKNPGFTAVALLSLTLGIGGNATIFTLVKAVFLQSILVKDPSTAVVIYATRQTVDGKISRFGMSSYSNSKDYRERNEVFSGLSMFMDASAQLSVSGSPKPVFVFVQLVNWDFFDILGVRPAMGRLFEADEDQASNPRPVVILSYALWNSQFGAGANILGKTIRLNEQDYSVVGVMPKGFQKLGELGSPDIWAPTVIHNQLITDPRKDWFPLRRSGVTHMVARLKPGVSLAQARVSMNSLGNRLSDEYPMENSGRNVELVRLSETIIFPEQHSLYVLAATVMMGIVGLVLLIACGNVANLLLARSTQRQHEFAVRRALGASRERLIRQLLTESLILGITAAALGIVFAYWARGIVWALLPVGKPPNLDFSLDGRVLLFTLGISIAATLLFGLAPSLQASRPQQMPAIRNRTNPPRGMNRWYGLRGMLVMSQITFSLIALVGSALFIHSLRNANHLDPGFGTKNELMVALTPGNRHYPQARAEQYYSDATEKVRALPMVAEAGIASAAPFNAFVTYAIFPEGVDASDLRNATQVPMIAVTPGYFSAAGIALLQGRDVNDLDDTRSDHVVVINQTLADQLWRGKDPVGKHLSFAAHSWKAEVIGVVRTVRVQTLGESPKPMLYFSLKQMYSPTAILYVRTNGDPNAAAPTISRAVQSLDPAIEVRTQSVLKQINGILTVPRLGAELLAGFGALALLLAAIGTYGVMSYSVSQRTQEIGLRMALGAQRGDVVKLILSNGMAMVFAGVLAGLGASIILTRSINSLLYGIGSFDATSFFAAAVVLIAVALVACWVPARRAMRVDPIVALRYE